MGSARINTVRQRIADSTYGGMGKFRKQGTDDVSDKVGTFMHNKFNEPNTRSEIMDNVLEDDKECKDEATCGQSSRFLKKKWDTQEYGNMGVEVKETAGTYVGPGAEHSQAVKYIKDKPVVGHEWLELPDESIVDASAGQFINPKHKPLKQRQRFRVIPKESGLHKYYKKDKQLQNMIDTKEGREEIKRVRKVLGFDDDATPKGMKQVKLPNGKIVTVPDRGAKSARIQTARQRLADIFDVIEGGGKIKPTDFRMIEPKETVMSKPETFLDRAVGGWRMTDPEANWIDRREDKEIFKKGTVGGDIQERRQIFRGDELGDVEYYRRKIRKGHPIQAPVLNIKGEKTTSHEGRRRSRALYEEGVEEMPIELFSFSDDPPYKLPTINEAGYKAITSEDRKFWEKLKREHPKQDPLELTTPESMRGTASKRGLGKYDPRPVLPKSSKSARIQMARERIEAI